MYPPELAISQFIMTPIYQVHELKQYRINTIVE